MAHDYQVTAQGRVGDLLELYLPTTTTGLTLPSLALEVVSKGTVVADAVAQFGLTMSEVDSVDAPGVYFLELVPDAAGSLFIRITHSGVVYEYTVQVSPALESTDPGLEGDYTLTVLAGVTPVPGASVRLYDAGGTTFVQRGTTDSQGVVTFYGLPVGNYQVRAYADGVDLQAVNPTTITVTPNAETSPRIDELVPSSASIGDVIGISGRFFDAEETTVLFGVGTPVSPVAVNAAGTLVLVEVPTGLTGTIVPVRVLKPDPNDPPSGTLQSAAVNLVRI